MGLKALLKTAAVGTVLGGTTCLLTYLSKEVDDTLPLAVLSAGGITTLIGTFYLGSKFRNADNNSTNLPTRYRDINHPKRRIANGILEGEELPDGRKRFRYIDREDNRY